MSRYEELIQQVTTVSRGFIIVNKRSIFFSDLLNNRELKKNVDGDEFLDSMLKSNGLRFRQYPLSSNSDIFVIGNHLHTNAEVNALISLFIFAGLKINLNQISAIVGIEIEKNVCSEYGNIAPRLSSVKNYFKLNKYGKNENIASRPITKNKTLKIKKIKPWATIAASVALAIIFGTMTTFMTSNIQQAEALLQQAEELLLIGDYQNALDLYDHVLQIDPNNEQAKKGKILAQFAQEQDPLNLRIQTVPELMENGENFSKQRQFGKAAVHYREVLIRTPDHLQALTGLGYAQYNMGDYWNSIQNFDLALEIKENDINSLNGLGLAYTKLGQYPEALAYLDKSIELDDENTNTLNAFGLFHTKFFEYLLAEQYFLLSLQLDEEKIETISGLAYVYYRDRQHEGAIGLFEEILKMSPSHRDALFGLGLAHVANGNVLAGQEFLDRVNMIDQNSIESVIIEVNDLILSDQSDMAIILIDNLLENDQNNVEAWVAKGNAHLGTDPSLALKSFNNALAIDPVYENAYVGKTYALIELSMYSDAKKILSDLTILNPENLKIGPLAKMMDDGFEP